MEKDGIRVTMRITGIDPNDFDFPVWAKVPNGKITMIARKRPASKGYEYFTDKAFHEYVKSIS
ncbi:hypothetical protein HOG21_06005 [bacterium]|nr:hypothetical protein [bacterium]